MEDHPDFLPFEDENTNHLIEKFQKMRSIGAHFYFDVEEFEQLIDHYLFDSDQSIVHEIIEIAKGQHPGSPALVLKEAEALVYSERSIEALELIEDVRLYDDSNPEHYFSIASIYSMADKKDKAIETLNRLIEISDNEDLAEAKMALAKEFQEIGDYPESIKIYQEILSLSDSNEDALMELSLSCELGGRISHGIEIIENYIDEYPYSHFAWFSLGNLHLTLENHKDAIRAYEYATVINEDFSEAQFNLGNAFMKEERFEDAIEAYKSSITKDYTDPVTFNFIGHCYIVLDENETAMEYFQKAVDQSPEYSDGWLGFAVALSNLNRTQEGLIYIEKAIKLNPKNMYYRYFHADMMFNIEDYTEAEILYKRVYESDIESTGIYLDYTESLILNDKNQEAIQVLVNGISKHPEESILYYRYSALMLQMGHEMDAESILMLALEINPDQSSQLFNFFPEAGNFEGIMDLIENYK
jgi:tetratricopeptide (TPR) repeat protein